MAKKKASIVIDHQEYTVEDLEKMKDEAVTEWRKADKAVNRAESRMRRAEETIRGCVSRIRLLKMLFAE